MKRIYNKFDFDFFNDIPKIIKHIQKIFKYEIYLIFAILLIISYNY